MKHKTKLQITKENIKNSLQPSVTIMLPGFSFFGKVSLIVSGIGLK